LVRGPGGDHEAHGHGHDPGQQPPIPRDLLSRAGQLRPAPRPSAGVLGFLGRARGGDGGRDRGRVAHRGGLRGGRVGCTVLWRGVASTRRRGDRGTPRPAGRGRRAVAARAAHRRRYLERLTAAVAAKRRRVGEVVEAVPSAAGRTFQRAGHQPIPLSRAATVTRTNASSVAAARPSSMTARACSTPAARSGTTSLTSIAAAEVSVTMSRIGPLAPANTWWTACALPAASPPASAPISARAMR